MYNYYICDMQDQNLPKDKLDLIDPVKNGDPAIMQRKNNHALTPLGKVDNDTELRQKVEARTEYLNSIKLLLS